MSTSQEQEDENDDTLFSYSNTMELTFGKKPRTMVSRQNRHILKCNDESSNSSDSDKECLSWKETETLSDDEDVNVVNEKDELTVINVDSYCRTSPSPPAPPKLDKKVGVVNRETAASFKALNKLKRVLAEDALETPPHAISRSKLDDLIVIADSPDSREMTIKIKCHGLVKRYKIAQNEPFANIINSIAKTEDTTGDKVMLYLGEKLIKQHDTPFTVDCNVADIFECVIVNEMQSGDVDDFDDSNEDGKVKIRIQTKESRSKEDYDVCKMSPLEEVVKKYCQRKNIKFDGVKIYFDGEELSLQDTPEGLEMENGDVIDLKYN